MKIKLISGILIIVLFTNMILMAFGRLNAIVFWGTIIACAVFAYRMLPALRKDK